MREVAADHFDDRIDVRLHFLVSEAKKPQSRGFQQGLSCGIAPALHVSVVHGTIDLDGEARRWNEKIHDEGADWLLPAYPYPEPRPP